MLQCCRFSVWPLFVSPFSMRTTEGMVLDSMAAWHPPEGHHHHHPLRAPRTKVCCEGAYCVLLSPHPLLWLYSAAVVTGVPGAGPLLSFRIQRNSIIIPHLLPAVLERKKPTAPCCREAREEGRVMSQNWEEKKTVTPQIRPLSRRRQLACRLKKNK